MKTKQHIAAAMLGVTLAMASGTVLAEQYYDLARVVSVTPEYERYAMPRQECYDEYQPGRSSGRSGERSYGGSVIGGITGAIVGNQVGQGHGREAATALGAITGAIVGDRIQNRPGDENWEPRTVRRCRNVEQWQERITAYRVVYEYGGRRYTTVTRDHPGNELRVRVSVDPYEY